MLVKAGKRAIVNAEDEPIVLIFENDEERIRVAKQLTNMPPRPGMLRMYSMHPDSCKQEDVEKNLDSIEVAMKRNP